MKLLVVLSMYVLATNAGVIDVNVNLDIFAGPISGDTQRLINAVISSDYNIAVSQALQLDRESKGNSIKDAVDRLIRGTKRNVLDFAYKLWIGEGQSIVKHFFPIQFRQLLSESNVKIINERDNLAIKLGAATDDLADRTAYGDANDKTSENVSWKLVPLWDDNKVFFKIQSVRRHQYLKLGTAADYAGDHVAYGSDTADTHRHHWYLKPVLLEEKVLFFIYNRQYNQALKLGRAIDDAGDRQVYSHAEAVDGSPELFGWSIRPLN